MFPLNYYLYAAAVIVIASLILSIRYIKRQETKEFDKDMSRTTAKHQILGNPAALAYVIGFAVLLVMYLISLVI